MASQRIEALCASLDATLEFFRELGLTAEAAASRFMQYRSYLGRLVEYVRRREHGEPVAPMYGEIQPELPLFIASVGETIELADMLDHLRSLDQDSLRPVIRKVLDGPALPSDEHSASNQARNTLFELVMGATLRRGGIPSVLEEPDVSCEIQGVRVFIACKRLFAPTKLARRLHQAQRQLLKRVTPGDPNKVGVISISLAKLFNPSNTPRQMPSRVESERLLASWLESEAGHAEKYWDPILRYGAAIAVLFHTSSLFTNLAVGRIESGSFFVVHSTNHPVCAQLEECFMRAKRSYT
jgi:hypothetical protein